MSTIFLIVSTISFIATWGVHMLAKNGVFGYNSYLFVPWKCAIPWISGFGLAVIPETFLLNISWYWVVLINIPITIMLGFWSAKIILRWFASGKGVGLDLIISIIVGFVFLAIGLWVD